VPHISGNSRVCAGEFRAICYFSIASLAVGGPMIPLALQSTACYNKRERQSRHDRYAVDGIINACDALRKGETKTVTPRRSPLVRRYMTQLIGARGAQRAALQGAPPTPHAVVRSTETS